MSTYSRRYGCTQTFFWVFRYRTVYSRRPSVVKPLLFLGMQLTILAQVANILYTIHPDPTPLIVLGVPAVGWAVWRTIEVMGRAR